MEFTVKQIAVLLGGEIQGSKEDKINKVSKIQEGEAGAISFLANPQYEKYIYDTQATAVLVNKSFVPKKELKTTLIVVEDPYSAFSTLLEEYQRLTSFNKKGIEQPSFIHGNTTIGEDIYVGAFAYISENVSIGKNCIIYPQVFIGDNVKIGDNVILYPGVKILQNSVVGNYCTINSGAVIGSPGFGFAPQADGTYKDIPQVGNVVLQDHVNIGANTTIDCATTGSTIIEAGVKLDNLIQIAHNVKIGKNTVMAAMTGVAGSTEIGENCMIGGQVAISGHGKIPNKTQIAGNSGVRGNFTEEGKTIMGSPAIDIRDFKRIFVVYKKLPELLRKIQKLEKEFLNNQ
ncbi:UDP-3-O-(3-hydroxymyristoyl)glucosamine N-acyltransferase [Flexithrix dorotheae]|uniref:UDP-3-O-(3-hydroxymyristoyl)glucosamine N-acyltransferase n=1 Tax=Flexithrix dorotheae TaxID=70993 RepID=UPI000372FE01|nr:UDP-3-O-(3-hydroxymyristoyl)glucosamine N-acyltransferase [Flexithrix dorotheae]